MYEVFEHTADLGLRARAETLEELFAESARALFSVIVANLDEVAPVIQLNFTIAGAQLDFLLFDWLSELVYTYEMQRVVLSDFSVKLIPDGLTAVARGEAVDEARHQLDHEVKAITYHGLKIARVESGDGQQTGWMAEVIVDI